MGVDKIDFDAFLGGNFDILSVHDKTKLKVYSTFIMLVIHSTSHAHNRRIHNQQPKIGVTLPSLPLQLHASSNLDLERSLE